MEIWLIVLLVIIGLLALAGLVLSLITFKVVKATIRVLTGLSDDVQD